MKTTINLDEALLKAAKRQALEENTTLGRLIARALKRELARPSTTQARALGTLAPLEGLEVHEPSTLADVHWEDEWKPST